MGCFSFLCKVCGDPINSDSFSGEHVHLFLLRHGQVIEEMHGQYDSYGRVFDENMESEEWGISWEDVCKHIHSKESNNGIAAIHSDCFNDMVPITESEGDPSQGWGEYKHSLVEEL